MTGYMAREFFQTSPLLALPVIALVLFVALFVVIFVRTMRMREVDEAALLPLSDESPRSEDEESPHG